MPIDGVNYPEVISKMPELVAGLEPLPGAMTAKPFMLPVAMSNHGATVFPQAPVVPHGVDQTVFRPPSEQPVTMSNGVTVGSKTEARRQLQIPKDAFLVVRVDRNSLRKNYADTVLALAPLMRKYSHVHAWFQCKAEDAAGIDLNLFVSRFPDIQDRFHWPGDFDTNQGWTIDNLKAVYAAGDVFVSTSAGEGFGLTLGEAASMELPIVAMNVSAIPETVGPGGILLDPERTYVPLSGQDNWLPDVAKFTAAIERLMNSRGARRQLGKAGRAHVAQFSWDEAAKRFNELITTVVQKASGAATAGGET